MPSTDTQTAPRFDIAPITLPGGWSGQVLLDWQTRDAGAPASSAAPTVEDWGRFLTPIACGDAPPDNADILKQSRTANVFQLRASVRSRTMDLVFKHSRAVGATARALHRLRGPREAGNWRRGFMLLRAGIATALPRALLHRANPKCESWIITEAVPDALDLDGLMSWHIYRMTPDRAVRIKRAVVTELADLCAKLDGLHLTHRDFKASNILVTDWKCEQDALKLWLIDLDGLRKQIIPTPNSSRQSMVRLAASLTEHSSVTRTDCARFLRTYLSAATENRSAWKQSWLRLSRAVMRYNAQARQRKRGKIDGFTGD